jgi:glycosyltransferase involved in cell wall biosynthesis
MKKRIVFDALKLSNPYVGLGQVAMHLGKALTAQLVAQGAFELCFLVPPEQHGVFGDSVSYYTPKWWQRYLPIGLPKADLWHSMHQDSSFLPPKNTPLLLTIHDFNFMYEKSPSKAAKRLARVKRLITRSVKISCISDFVRTELQHFAVEGYAKSITIYNGVPDLNALATVEIVSGNYLFSVANWTARKQLHRLIELMESLPDQQLIVAGNVDTAYARPLVQAANEKQLNIRFVGKVSDVEKANYFAQCLAFVFPSRVEGFGLPIVEAMQFGKPVIISDGTCLPEIGRDLAYYWREHDDTTACIATLQKAIGEHNEQRAAALKARAKAFSWEKAALDFWREYKMVTND